MHCVQINAACIIDEASVLDSGRKDALCLCILYPLMYLGWHKQSWNPELPISRAVGMLSAAVGWLWCKGGLTSFSGELFIFRVVYGSLCPSLQVKRWSLKTTTKKSSRVLFATMCRLWICARPRAECLLKKITEEQDQLSHSLRSMFVSSVCQDQSSGTSLQRMETSRGHRTHCTQSCHPHWCVVGKKNKA